MKRTPENGRSREEAARKARAEHLVRCSLMPGKKKATKKKKNADRIVH